MDWINLHTSTLDSAEFIGADPTCRATWLCLLRYCCGQENGGRVVDCASWSDRRWQQLARVTKREVTTASDLWTWDGNDLVVWEYPTEKEEEVARNRENGRLGGRPKNNNHPVNPKETTRLPEPETTRFVSAETERNRKGIGIGKERKDMGVSAEAVYGAYPKKVGRADALKAIKATLKAGAIAPDALLAKVQAYAAAVATWPEADRKFVPHPATWFNRGSFDDDPATWQRGDARTANGGFTGEVASVRPKGWGTELLDGATAARNGTDLPGLAVGEGKDTGVRP